MKINYEEIVLKMKQLNILYRYYAHSAVKGSGLHIGQPAILNFILENDGCTQKELAAHMSVSPPSIATSVKRLEKKGMVIKRSDTLDRRLYHLSITDKGREHCRKSCSLMKRIDVQMFKGLTERQCREFARSLEAMSGNLSDKAFQGEINIYLSDDDLRFRHKRKGDENV